MRQLVTIYRNCIHIVTTITMIRHTTIATETIPITRPMLQLVLSIAYFTAKITSTTITTINNFNNISLLLAGQAGFRSLPLEKRSRPAGAVNLWRGMAVTSTAGLLRQQLYTHNLNSSFGSTALNFSSLTAS